MSSKTLLKFGAAFVVLAAVLIFLGVNFVPRIFASSSVVGNNVVSGKQTRFDYIDERYPRAIALQLSYVGSDWIERHPVQVAEQLSYVGSDWIERHPSNYFSNSDWIERHP
jgi:hypothetical protein